MNCATFLLNELLANIIDVHERGTHLTYLYWFLILIYFVAWVEPLNYQVMETNVSFRRAQYLKNLWFEEKN